MESSKKVMRNLARIYDDFVADERAWDGPSIHHVLIVTDDDVPIERVYGAEGLVQTRETEPVIQAPDFRGHIFVFEGTSVIQAPEWTEEGKSLHLHPLTLGMLPEARKRFIAKPGKIAYGFIASDTDNPHSAVRRIQRFRALARDAAISFLTLASAPSPDSAQRTSFEAMKSYWLRHVHARVAD